MKRLIIVCVTIALIVGVCAVSLYKVNTVNAQIQRKVTAIYMTIEAENKAALYEQVTDLVDYWVVEEEQIIHYVRHAQVDDITKAISRLKALVEYENYGDLRAELDSILWQVEHIWSSEQLWLKNLL